MMQNTQREAAIRAAALDYAEGWFEGDAERMERCLHPHLAKRALEFDPKTGEKTFKDISKGNMVRGTREGGGTDVPRDKIFYKIDIVEVYQEVAIVRCETYPYVDFLQLVNDEGNWLLVNVLYTVKRTET